MYNHINEVIQLVEYSTDQGSIFEDNKYFSLFGRDPIASYQNLALSSKNLVDNSFTMISLLLSTNRKDIYVRNYKKIQSAMASIGGAINLLMVLASQISSYITFKELSVTLSNDFVHHEDESDKIEKNNQRRGAICG